MLLSSPLENVKTVKTSYELQALYHSFGSPQVTCNLWFCSNLSAVIIQFAKQTISQINGLGWGRCKCPIGSRAEPWQCQKYISVLVTRFNLLSSCRAADKFIMKNCMRNLNLEKKLLVWNGKGEFHDLPQCCLKSCIMWVGLIQSDSH